MPDFSQPLSNARHELFAQCVAKGESATAAYGQAGYSPKDADVSAPRLIKNAGVRGRIAWFQQQAAVATVLSMIEKREFLARVVRTPLGLIDENSDLCHSVEYVTGGSGGRVAGGERSGSGQAGGDRTAVRVRGFDKLKAIALDNVLAGHGSEAAAHGAIAAAGDFVVALRALTHGKAS